LKGRKVPACLLESPPPVALADALRHHVGAFLPPPRGDPPCFKLSSGEVSFPLLQLLQNAAGKRITRLSREDGAQVLRQPRPFLHRRPGVVATVSEGRLLRVPAQAHPRPPCPQRTHRSDTFSSGDRSSCPGVNST